MEDLPYWSSSGAKPENMKLKNINSIFRSFILVPLIASSMSMSAFTASISTAIQSASTVAAEELTVEQIALQVEREQDAVKAAKIDAYFEKREMPLAGHGAKFVAVAREHNLDWRLLPAIAVREQSGGKILPYNCPGKTKNYNAFGWASGKICFTSFDKAIETVGYKLATLSYYKGKDVEGILKTYNPPHVVALYSNQVMSIMSTIENIAI